MTTKGLIWDVDPSHFSLFTRYGIELEPAEEALFRKFLELFMEYNTHTNLSAIRTPEGIVEKHFIDSLMLGNFVELSGKVLDIGSGGGFPGIPLKILFPEADFMLLDSVGKKVRAMNHFIDSLGLTGIRAIQGRAEEVVRLSLRGTKQSRSNKSLEKSGKINLDRHAPLAMTTTLTVEWNNPHEEYFHGFDFIVSRATAYLPQILAWAEPFLSDRGQIILYKLASPDELAEGKKILRKLGLKLAGIEEYDIAGQARVFLIFERNI